MFDYLIRNAAVADGSGADVYTADVAISGGVNGVVGGRARQIPHGGQGGAGGGHRGRG